MKISEILYSRGGEELPDVLYHGTTLENAKKILKVGLDPKLSELRDDYEIEDGGPFVWIGWNLEGAEDFAPGGDYGIDDENVPGAILEIRLPEEIAKKCISDIGEFLRCPVIIPPQYIKLLKITNQKSK